MTLKRIVIVIVAGLAFGVTAAYATTNHSSAGKAPASKPASAATFATQADQAGPSTTTGADDPVTHDQADDQGQDEQTTGDTGDTTDQADSQGDDSQGDDSLGDDSQGGAQSGSDQSDGSHSGGGSGGSGSGNGSGDD
jgi:hypothetical protein